MTEKLTDPSKPAHAIIKVLEDGGAMRNDGVRLQAANKNPWYVLATIYGEQEEGDFSCFGEELAARNRRAWNGWICTELSKEERKDRAEKVGLDVAELMPLNEADLAEITKRFCDRMGNQNAKLPDPSGHPDFSKLRFSRPQIFEHFVFDKFCDFSFSMFCGYASFRFSVFSRGAVFNGTMFGGYANFGSAMFGSFAGFGAVVFNKIAEFNSANFLSYAYFKSTTFGGEAAFSSAMFGGEADFSSVMFGGETEFRNVAFWDYGFFRSSKFKSKTRFNDAQFFTAVPEFHAAELYDDTVFPTPDNYTDNWPPLKGKDVMPAADQKRAYNRLRLFMNRSLQIDEEQFFHRQEMRCKMALADWWHKPFYWLYAWLSDYGNSVWRPMAWMIAVMLSGALFRLWWQGAFTFLPKESTGFDWTLGLLGEDDPWAKPRQAAGWSISNTLPFLGLGKLYYGELAKELAWPLKVAGGVQTLLGYVLLFFLGLGLRNRFRLR